MDKKALIKEISQLKEKYHCEKLDVEIREHFEIENGAVSLCGIAAIVDVGNDLFFCDDKYGSYCDFIADLREKVALRKRHVYNMGWYEKIARDVMPAIRQYPRSAAHQADNGQKHRCRSRSNRLGNELCRLRRGEAFHH